MSEIRRILLLNTPQNDAQKKWEQKLNKMQCFFYAPLNQFGDLTDHITGTVGAPYARSGSIPYDNLTWSEENSCYLLHTQYGGQHALTFPIPNLASRLTGNDITHVVTVKRPSYINKFCYTFGIGREDAGQNGWSLSHWFNRVYLSESKFITLTIAINYTNRTCYLYIDNSLSQTYSMPSSWNGFKPNWKPAWYNYITINGTYGADGGNASYEGCAYFKECAMFNKVLTQNEIAEIVAHNNV